MFKAYPHLPEAAGTFTCALGRRLEEMWSAAGHPTPTGWQGTAPAAQLSGTVHGDASWWIGSEQWHVPHRRTTRLSVGPAWHGKVKNQL